MIYSSGDKVFPTLRKDLAKAALALLAALLPVVILIIIGG
jgi:hypothetical protein